MPKGFNATPTIQQVKKWLESYKDVKQVLGSINRAPSSVEEKDALKTLSSSTLDHLWFYDTEQLL